MESFMTIVQQKKTQIYSVWGILIWLWAAAGHPAAFEKGNIFYRCYGILFNIFRLISSISGSIRVSGFPSRLFMNRA